MPAISPPPTVHRRLAFWLFATAFTVRVLVLLRFADSPDFVPNGDDMKFYNDWALRIMHGSFTDGHAFYGLPGYAWCLAGIYSVLGFNPLPVGVLQCAFDATTTVLIFLIGSRVFREAPEGNGISESSHAEMIGLLAALGWVCFLPAQTFSMILMPTSWLLVVFWGCVWWLVKVRAPSLWRPWLAMGTLIGAIAMLVASVFVLLPLVLFAIARRVAVDRPLRERVPRGLASAAILFAGVIVGCSPVLIHNRFIAEDRAWTFTAHDGLNFYMGNNALATGYPKIPAGLSASQEGLLRDSITLAEKEAGHPLKRVEVSKHWSEKANAWIRANRAAWRRLMAVKFGNFWNAFQYDDLSIIKLLQIQGVLPPGLRFGFVAALGLPGMIYGAWRFPRARWVAAAVLLHMAAVMPVFITERYRLCAAPGLMIFASYGLGQFWRWLLDARWLAAAGWIAATGGAAWFVSIPRAEIGMWSLDHFNTGLRAVKTENFDQAQRELELAYAYVQDNAEINFALGTLWQQKGNPGRASFFYKRTVDLDPKHASAWSNLGVLSLEQKDYAQSVRFLQRSLEHDPDDAKTHFLLARAFFETGNRDEARRAIRRALELRPEQPEFQALRTVIDAP